MKKSVAFHYITVQWGWRAHL